MLAFASLTMITMIAGLTAIKVTPVPAQAVRRTRRPHN